MEYELTCLYGCGHTSTADSREGVGVLVMEHMDDEHDTPVDPLEAGELALKRFDGASLRQARQ
ncbi:DUF1059 domain-containing protein [Haloferax sp. Atlit-12N]|uniref:DUF1059 domain-containing protein n=3 Tax=Haloferax TaxID=2251 RepID=A0A0K1IVP8_HALGI|nr:MULTISPECIES: hypothetical protein [Haloferax]AKU08368.1 hypothetical protein ABY42_11730 [Haloferax gibbonsii]ELZ66378.1 hypothetical protein C457_14568 [Haloferax prahovense DSM 18310]ELZ80778.1 hypothetical protein C454_10746 [Haloferax gibbonsii ATCC 33959]QOS12485.1 uncharacterized protein HfgLR_11740 [Haloferax gibbonsii]RDZ48016.1 DUF1059 domain-containing protein [Haloferax sp. Atlit-19N]